jgi:hypothetical protein
MKTTFDRKAIVAVATAGILLTACVQPTTQSFVRVENSRVDSSYIAVGADFSKYDRLSAEDMGIFFPTNRAPSAEDQQRARDLFREAFMAQLSEYEVVRNAKGPTTLQVQATLIDFTNAAPEDAMSVGREMRDFAKPGSIIFLMELKDSMSGTVLARAGDSAEIPAFSTSPDVLTDWDAVEAAAQRWALMFREFLDNNLKR